MTSPSHNDEPPSLQALFDRMTPDRIERLHAVVGSRMKGLTVALEGLYDAGNRSAVYRSAEAFGLRDVHIIRPETTQKPHARSVSRGAEKWVDLYEYDSPGACVETLRAQGFSVYAADLRAARPLHTIDFAKPVALVFGNERHGISAALRDACDGAFVIPMAGFTQSFNVSVAAALALAHARRERERALGSTTDLSPEEAAAMLDDFARRSSRWLHRLQGRGRGKDARSNSWKALQDAEEKAKREARELREDSES